MSLGTLHASFIISSIAFGSVRVFTTFSYCLSVSSFLAVSKSPATRSSAKYAGTLISTSLPPLIDKKPLNPSFGFAGCVGVVGVVGSVGFGGLFGLPSSKSAANAVMLIPRQRTPAVIRATIFFIFIFVYSFLYSVTLCDYILKLFMP